MWIAFGAACCLVACYLTSAGLYFLCVFRHDRRRGSILWSDILARPESGAIVERDAIFGLPPALRWVVNCPSGKVVGINDVLLVIVGCPYLLKTRRILAARHPELRFATYERGYDSLV